MDLTQPSVETVWLLFLQCDGVADRCNFFFTLQLAERNRITFKMSDEATAESDWTAVELGPAAGDEPVKITERLEAADGILYKIDGVLDLED